MRFFQNQKHWVVIQRITTKIPQWSVVHTFLIKSFVFQSVKKILKRKWLYFFSQIFHCCEFIRKSKTQTQHMLQYIMLCQTLSIKYHFFFWKKLNCKADNSTHLHAQGRIMQFGHIRGMILIVRTYVIHQSTVQLYWTMLHYNSIVRRYCTMVRYDVPVWLYCTMVHLYLEMKTFF